MPPDSSVNNPIDSPIYCVFQDKMTALVVANYFLWPLTRYLNDTFVPAEHRVTANHIITVSFTPTPPCIRWMLHCVRTGFGVFLCRVYCTFRWFQKADKVCAPQVVWNAWLSTLGHAPQVDPTDLLHKMGGESLFNHVSEHVAPALADAGAAVSNAVSPFVHQATVVRTRRKLYYHDMVWAALCLHLLPQSDTAPWSACTCSIECFAENWTG